MTMVTLFRAEIRNIGFARSSCVIKCFAANKLFLNLDETNVMKF